MKKIMQSRWREILAYAVIPVVVGMSYIIKVLTLPDCLAFETNDEVAQTFLEIPRAWKLMTQGTLPLMNLYNNFGTPMIGDPVVNPFALHTMPYLMFSAPVAATLNRFLAISFTISLLTFFYHRYFSLSLFSSSVAAIWVVSLPAFSHFSVHHPHQDVVLYFTFILIMQHETSNNPTIKNLIGLYVSLVIFSLGVGLNPFFFAWPFLLLNQFLLSGCRFRKSFLLFAAVAFSVLVLLYPHLASFLQYLPLTARATLDYADLLPYTFKRLLMDILFFRKQPSLIHVSDAVYYSLPALLLAAMGFNMLKTLESKLRFMLLAILPFILVMLILLFGDIRSWVSFLKPVDITRFLWFANVFIAILVGTALDRIWEGALSQRARTAFFAIFFVYFFLFFIFFQKYFAATFLIVLLFATAIFSQRYILAQKSRQTLLEFDLSMVSFFSKRNPMLFSAMALTALFFSFIPVYSYYTGLEHGVRRCIGFGYAKANQADFQPKKYLEFMKPNKRIATQFEPVTYPYLQQATKYDMFGSDGRSIILNANLKKYLSAHSLIREGWCGMTYYFTSKNAEQLRLLGIRYFLAKEPNRLTSDYWKEITNTGSSADMSRYMPFQQRYVQSHLYEAKEDVSVGYLESGKAIHYLHDLTFRGNRITVALPALKKETNLVLAFVNWPGWTVLVDGEPAKLQPSEPNFLKTTVGPGNRLVVFEFKPYTIFQVIRFVVASFLLFFLILLATLSYRKTLDETTPNISPI